MAYTVPTFAQAKAALAARLNDPTMIRWIDAELGTYIREALRTWAAWTSHWREGATFDTVPVQPFYDLGTVLPTLRPQTLTQWDLITDIEYALLEPPTPTAWTGTAQFDLAQVSTAIQRRRDLFLQTTGAVLTRALTAYAQTADGRVALDEAVMTVRRAAWRPDATQLLIPLMRADEWSANHYQQAWQTAGTPSAYSIAVTPPLSLQLMPPMDADGALDLLSVNKGADFPVPTTAVLLGVPDDWAWVIKYGALADLLGGDGLATDPSRAAYCEQRWAEGLAQAAVASVVLSAAVAGVPLPISSVSEADSYSPLWQLVGGTPTALILAGQTLVATAPIAGGATTITLDVVRNVPVPVADADILQVTAAMYDSILDLAQFTAVFKEGAGQLQAALGLYQRAATAAGVATAIQQASQPSRAQLTSQQQFDESALPRALDPAEVG